MKRCECGCGRPTLPSARTDAKRGVRRGEPARFIRGHSGVPESGTRATRSDLFWSHVDVGDCWHWTGSKTAKGYGLFHDGEKTRRAHRWAWEHLVGPIPEGFESDHRCFNTSCVNPDHIVLVTQATNLARRRRYASTGTRARNPQG